MSWKFVSNSAVWVLFRRSTRKPVGGSRIGGGGPDRGPGPLPVCLLSSPQSPGPRDSGLWPRPPSELCGGRDDGGLLAGATQLCQLVLQEPNKPDAKLWRLPCPDARECWSSPVKQTWRNLTLLHAEAGASCGEKWCLSYHLALITSSCDMFTPLRTLPQSSQPKLCFHTPDFYLASPFHPGHDSTQTILCKTGTPGPWLLRMRGLG